MRDRVLLAVPGPTVTGPVVQNLLRTQYEVSKADKFDLTVKNYIGETGWQNHNSAWVDALNAADEEGISYIAMLHADVDPQPNWLIDLWHLMKTNPQYGLLSCPVAIKDPRGLLSCGMGDTANPWWPWRRLTNYEGTRLPKLASEKDLFDMWDLPRPNGTFLLHNDGCWIADPRRLELRKKVEDGHGGLDYPFFTFPIRIHRKRSGMRMHCVPHELALTQANEVCTEFRQSVEGMSRDTALVMADHCEARGYTAGAALLRSRAGAEAVRFAVECNPEDFNFSRMLYLAGVKTALASEIETHHWFGHMKLSSRQVVRPGQPMGMWKFDHDAGGSNALTDAERKQIRAEAAWYDMDGLLAQAP